MKRNNPWTWVPSLFFSEGLAFVGITMLSLILYKQLGLNNAEITFYTGWLYLPWVIRPLWRPFLDLFRTRRWWLLSAELLIGAAFGGVALAIPTSVWLQGTLVAFWLAAFALAVHYSVAHDVYEAELVHERRRWFRKVQSIACYLGMIFGQGILVMIAGNVQVIQRGSISYSWSLVCYAVTGIFILLWLWNGLLLPRGETGHLHRRFNLRRVWNETVIVVRDFLEQPQIVPSVLFLLFFIMPEGLLSKVSSLFLIDVVRKGGLGLSPQEYGLVQGSVGIAGLLIGFIGGVNIISKDGLQRWIWPITLAAMLPHALYLYLSEVQPAGLLVTGLCVLVEQIGFGLGLAAYLFYIGYICRTGFRTFYHTMSIAFMAVSMMISGLFSGTLQEQVGYNSFFLIVLMLSILPLIAVALIRIDPDFGKRMTGKSRRIKIR